jgi:hypothetical protein
VMGLGGFEIISQQPLHDVSALFLQKSSDIGDGLPLIGRRSSDQLSPGGPLLPRTSNPG